MSVNLRADSEAPLSPCNKVCVIDPASGFCRGCRRTLDEIAAWGSLTPEAHRGILAQLPERRLGDE
jgi:predicted Fe-S protein YdhL (DUF1289 family)